MKKLLLILFPFVLFSCGDEDINDLGKNEGILYHYLDPGFSGSSCQYVIEVDDKTYIPLSNVILSEFSAPYGNTKIKITYSITGENQENCHHNNINNQTLPTIELTSISKL